MDEEDLANSMQWQPQPFKPAVTCWGCEKKQSDCDHSFMECPKCNEMKLIKSKFCSQDCFAEHWPRHSEYHKAQKQIKKEAVKKKMKNEESDEEVGFGMNYLVKDCDDYGDYDRLIDEGGMHMDNMELSLARIKFRKAMKLNPKRPDAYHDLACCYLKSDMIVEAVIHFEMAVARYAFVALTGEREGFNKHNDPITDWVDAVYEMLSQCLKYKLPGWKKRPLWLTQDELLNRVTKMANDVIQAADLPLDEDYSDDNYSGEDYSDKDHSDKDYSDKDYSDKVSDDSLGESFDTRSFDEHEKSQMSWFRAYCMSGHFSGGTHVEHPGAPPQDTLTCHELMEVAVCFRKACSDNNTDEVNAQYLALSEKISKAARAKARETNPTEPQCASSRFFPGVWVIIHGLKSKAGRLLNQKPGFVCGYDEQTGRVLVEVAKEDTGIKQMSLTPGNLEVFPLENDDHHVLLSTMEKSAQWDYINFQLK